MFTKPSRRNFLKTSGAVAATALIDAPHALSADNASPALEKRWFKGNLNMHNQWSDGKPLPEYAIHWFRTHRYDFVCPSDHNIFQSDELRFDGFGFNNQPSDLAAFKDETSLWRYRRGDRGFVHAQAQRSVRASPDRQDDRRSPLRLASPSRRMDPALPFLVPPHFGARLLDQCLWRTDLPPQVRDDFTH